MGRMVDGQWTQDKDLSGGSGAFVRPPTRFRDRISADDGAPHPVEPGRYHLYVSLACPWAHRTLIARRLRGLEACIGVSVVHWLAGTHGWEFKPAPGCIPDSVNQSDYLYQIYQAARAHYTGRVTVPVLWDKTAQTIVNNESREIIEMFDGELCHLGDETVTLYPDALRADIDAMIDANYDTINNGVYRAGFAGNQQAYDEAVASLFQRLDTLESVLESRRFLCGSKLTAADVCLFTTLVRFDAVYNIHFKCSVKRIADYPNLWAYTRDIYQHPGVAETCNFDHIRNHYYASHESLNPRRIVASMPAHLRFDAPHQRARLASD